MRKRVNRLINRYSTVKQVHSQVAKQNNYSEPKLLNATANRPLSLQFSLSFSRWEWQNSLEGPTISHITATRRKEKKERVIKSSSFPLLFRALLGMLINVAPYIQSWGCEQLHRSSFNWPLDSSLATVTPLLGDSRLESNFEIFR